MRKVYVFSSGKTQATQGPMSFEKKDIGEVVLTEKSYDHNMGMYAPTVTEKPVAVVVPKIPENAIVIAFMPGYFFKHNTRAHCPRGREIARGCWQGLKQSHSHLLAWLLPGEEIVYTKLGQVGMAKTFCKGVWAYDGTYLYNEVLESTGESGPHNDRHMVHGKPGIRAVIPVHEDDEAQMAAWEKSRKNAAFAAAGATHERVTYTPDGLGWYLTFSLDEEVKKRKSNAAQKWAALKDRITRLGLKIGSSVFGNDAEFMTREYGPRLARVEQILDWNKKIEEARRTGKPPFLTDYQWERCKPVVVLPDGWDRYNQGIEPSDVKRAEEILHLLTVPPTHEELDRLAEGKRRMRELNHRREAAGASVIPPSIVRDPDAFYLTSGVVEGKYGEYSFADLETVKSLEEQTNREIGGVPNAPRKKVATEAVVTGERASASQLEALRERFSKK